MSMTRKDYVLIAASFADTMQQQRLRRLDASNLESINTAKRNGILQAMHDMADTLKRDNSAFDKGRFLTACGVSA